MALTLLNRPLSTQSRFNLLCLLLIALALGLQWLFIGSAPWLSAAICLAGLGLALLLHWTLQPLMQEIAALNLHAQNLQDGSFNTSANQACIRQLGGLANSLQQMSAQLRTERATLYQRELLLDSVLQSSPSAFLLTDTSDTVLMYNPAAQQLLQTSQSFAGSKLASVTEAIPALAEAIAQKQPGMLRLADQSVWHLAINQFQLNHKQHWLYLLKPLTREIQREELTAWKKLLRVIGHELNNTLAPLSSLAFSGQQRAKQLQQTELADLFGTMQARATDLNQFVQAYIHFAKLPPPQRHPVNWSRLVNQLQDLYDFELIGPLPQSSWQADPQQVQQLLLNLLKNAVESGSPPEQIKLQFRESDQQLEIRLQDGGCGMTEQQLQHALVPFYSTKQQGSGIGLTLCRDIIEAHNGSISLHNTQANTQAGLEVRLVLPRYPEQAAS
ncbi:ATP-binding protein [Alkalimonas sp. NCh-2]|uniref:sensor histidine kinase n=1 Tax=Alkalimonas sp. NCh-2 TaxID=3144846 RepID=UPI0031F66106